jgi:hypothetical protein
MNGLLSRGNLILGVSWALAVTMFLARGRHVDGGVAGGAAKAPPRVRVTQEITAPVVAPDASPLEVPVSAEIGDAVSRNDQAAPLP